MNKSQKLTHTVQWVRPGSHRQRVCTCFHSGWRSAGSTWSSSRTDRHWPSWRPSPRPGRSKSLLAVYLCNPNKHIISNRITSSECFFVLLCNNCVVPPSTTGRYAVVKAKKEVACLNDESCLLFSVYLKASRPVKGPVSVLGLGWLRKSFSISLAKDFCTNLQYGEWKTR